MSQMVEEDFSEELAYKAYELRNLIEFFLYLEQPINNYVDADDFKMISELTKAYGENHEQ